MGSATEGSGFVGSGAVTGLAGSVGAIAGDADASGTCAGAVGAGDGCDMLPLPRPDAAPAPTGKPSPIGPSSGSGITSGGGRGRRGARVGLAEGVGVGVGVAMTRGKVTPSSPGTSCAAVAAVTAFGTGMEAAMNRPRTGSTDQRWRRYARDSIISTRLP